MLQQMLHTLLGGDCRRYAKEIWYSAQGWLMVPDGQSNWGGSALRCTTSSKALGAAEFVAQDGADGAAFQAV